MGSALSRGPGLLRSWLLSYLQTQVPILITRARTDWSLTAYELPSVQDFDVYDVPKADAYPVVGCYFQNEVNFNRRDYTDRMEEEYWVKHQGQVTVWVSTPYADAQGTLASPGRDTCLRLRDDLTELVKQALLLTPSLGHATECWLEETSIAVNKMEPFRAKENSAVWLAGSVIPIAYNMRNELVRAPMGVANTIVKTVKKLTP